MKDQYIITTEGVMEQLMRKAGKRRYQLMEETGIAGYDTIRLYFKQPETMSGVMRQKMAEGLGITIEQMDDICNRKLEQFTQENGTFTE